MSKVDNKSESGVATREKQQIQEPSLYKVLLHNDDYTTMDFVIMVLETVFSKNVAEATRIMMNVHQQGIGIAGVYTRDIAETKVAVVHNIAHKNEFPLKCSLEKE